MLKEHCGIIAIKDIDGRDVAQRIYEGLIALQHRGQESAGIAVSSGNRITLLKNLGLVIEAIKFSDLKRLKGSAGIGHVRYSTTGHSTIDEAQPMIYHTNINNKEIYFGIAFNGTISNYHELKRLLNKRGYRFHTDTDTEVLAALISYHWESTGDIFEALKESMKDLDGAYSVVILTENGEIHAMRDPLGFKPLVLGKRDEIFIIASESAAINALGGELLRDIAPGEIVSIFDDDVFSKIIIRSNRRAHCMFEYIYFSRPDSVINGISVYDVRFRLGEILAELYPIEADIVVPVPDTGVIAALGYSRVSGIPVAMGLIRNPYVGRTFIKPSQTLRELSVQLKMGVVRRVISDKRIVLIDDSIVRGTTIKWIIKLLRRAGAAEIHVRITCPPIRYPCYMGIDFPMRRELIASNHCVEEIRRIIGADSLGYMTVEGLIKAIGLGKNELCLACLTGEYPIKRAQIPVLEKIFGGVRK